MAAQERGLKPYVVADNSRIADKAGQAGDHRRQPRSVLHLFVADAGELLNLEGDRPQRVDQGREGINDLGTVLELELDSPDFSD